MVWNKANRRVSSKWLALVALLLIPVFVGAGQDNERRKDEKRDEKQQTRERKEKQPKNQRETRESRPQGGTPERRTQGRPENRGQQTQTRQQRTSPSPRAQGRPAAAPERNAQGPGRVANSPSPNTGRGRYAGTQPGGAPNRGRAVQSSPQQAGRNVNEMNRGRVAMRGINKRPLPQGQVTMGANGRQTIKTHDGRQIVVRQNRTVARVQMPDGRVAAFRANGSIRSFRTANNNLVVQNGLRGNRRIVTVGSRGDRVVSYGPRRGYYERPYARGYYQRTYWAGDRPYARIYRPVRWRGNVYYRYVPVHYYHPVFYAWAYRPWHERVYYRWGWYGMRPAWYSYYGPYFAPSPWYLTASLWLTDFMIAEELQAAWQARQDAYAAAAAQQQSAEYPQQGASAPPPDEPPQAGDQGQGQPSATSISPEEKQLIAEEVQRQLQAQQAAAANPQQAASAPQQDQPPLDLSQQVFVVSNNLDTSANGQECELTAGDVLYRVADAPSENQTFTMKVTSSKASDCPARSTVEIAVEDLQEMQNDFRARIDDGMDNLAKDQGQGGMPAAPDTATSPSGAPPPSPDSAADVQDRLQQQQSAADAAEGQVEQQATEDQSAQGNP